MTNLSITLTSTALNHIEKLCRQHDANGLLINIKTSGCSGYSYDFQIITKPSDEMEVIHQENGFFVAFDKKHLSILQGSQLDYVKEGLNKHFKFTNPNEQGTCGCGESFYLNKEK